MRQDLSREFNPAPKLTKPNRKKKKREKVKGITIPPRKVRGSVSKADYNKAIEKFGNLCLVCGNPKIEMHHVRPKGMSNNGRGGWRNLSPLCAEHHRGKTGVHANYEGLSDRLKEERERIYGPWFWADRFDLWKVGVISNCTEEAFEKYMQSQEMKVYEMDKPSR